MIGLMTANCRVALRAIVVLLLVVVVAAGASSAASVDGSPLVSAFMDRLRH
jgi:hypothetical protein